MLGPSMEERLNAQINAEFYSAFLYLSMAAYFEAMGLKGFANWMRVQRLEEEFHAQYLYDFVCSRGGRVRLGQIDGPPIEWSSPLEAFTQALAHEQLVTGLINSLVDLATSESDHASRNFLMWYVTEQIEEEANVCDVISKLKLVGGSGQGLMLMDTELGQRVFKIPAEASLATAAVTNPVAATTAL